ncbi:FkbM family methyltransferase [Lamprobacter modestohalophilus]|uniref:FkbM family methyltransferase n=1 Tax=Lamprobacter modestohalophilus TaxID=1064514 RepID=UPI00190484F4|nr:FkbM family methyltransferase [Lamprobacter modestohalophilus]
MPYQFGQKLSQVIDVGANQGSWTRSIGQFFSVGSFDLVEPNPYLIEDFLFPIRDSLNNVTVHQCALGSSEGSAKLNITKGSALSSLLPVLDIQQRWHGDSAAVMEEVEVPVKTLDALFANKTTCDLLKVDVQGLEKQVLEGGGRLLSRTRCLLLELDFERHYAGDTSWYELARYLIEDLGFQFWDMSPPERRADGRALWADVCFVRDVMEV